MKNLIISLVLICFGSNILGQSKDWKQIEIPSNLSLEIIYQSSSGDLFGRILVTDELKFSDDNGISWTTIQIDTISGSLDYTIKIKENATGDIFFSNNNILYKFNKEFLKFSKFIVLNEYYEIIDFDFLKTGDILLANIKNLYLYSSIGKLKKSHPIFTTYAQILPDKLGQKNYIFLNRGNSYNIVEFNDDLSYISEYKKFEIHNYNPRIMKRIDEKLFISLHYSDDGGVTWLSNNFPTTNVNIRTFNLGHDNTIFWAGDTQLFFSKDKGKTIHSVPIPISTYSNFISSSKSGEIVLCGIECNQSEIVHSYDDGIQWVKIESDIGPSFVDKGILKAGIEENLYLNDCNGLKYKESEYLPWKLAEINLDYFYSYFKFFYSLPLSNMSTIGVHGYSGLLFNTFDKGKTWNKIPSWSIEFNRYLVEKEGVIFSYDLFLNFQISRDFGYSWENYQSKDTIYNFLFDFYEVQFTKELCFYCLDIENRLIKYNLKTHEIKIIPDSLYIRDYKTSFSGNTLFILGSAFNDNKKIYLQTTSDDGYTYTTFPINIANNSTGRRLYVDYLDNVYIYNDKEIFLSFDKGKTWQNITPDFPELISINDVQVSYDDFLYLSTTGMGILKYRNPVSKTNEILRDGIKVYPNPSSGVFSIFGLPNDDNSGLLKVFNIHGKLIKTQHLNSFNTAIDISYVKPGIYFITVNSTGGFYQTKLIKH